MRRLFQLQPRIAVSFRRGTRFKEWAKGAPRPMNATDGCRAREDTAALHAPARLRKTAAGAHARKRHLRNSVTDATAGRTPPRARPVHTGGGRCSKRAPTGREGLRVPPMGARGAKRGAIKTPTGIKRIFQNFSLEKSHLALTQQPSVQRPSVTVLKAGRSAPGTSVS